MDISQNVLSSELQIDHVSHAHLKETAMWAKFIGVTGFVISLLLVLVAVFAGSLFSKMTSTPYGDAATAGFIGAGVITAIYLVIAVVYFLMSLYLYRFAVRMKTALASNDQESLNNSFLNLKLVYRIIGILIILYLGLMVLGLVASIAMSAMG